MVVDSDVSAKCAASTTLHELGHIFSLEYNNPGDEYHYPKEGFIMNSSSNCNLTWSKGSRSQIRQKLESGELDRIIVYE